MDTCFEITIGSKQLVLVHVRCKCARVLREPQLQWRTANETLCGPFIQQQKHGRSVEINPGHEAAKWITAGFCPRSCYRQLEHVSPYKGVLQASSAEFNNSAGDVKSIPFFFRFLVFPFFLSLCKSHFLTVLHSFCSHIFAVFYTFLSVIFVVCKQGSFYELLTHVCCCVSGLTPTLSFMVCND